MKKSSFPVNADIPAQAVYWFIELGSDPQPDTLMAWKNWLTTNSAHERAWQHLQSMDAQWNALPDGFAKAALATPKSPGRRHALRNLCLISGGVAAVFAGSRYEPALWSDIRTAVGEQRSIDLADGSKLILNTASAINIDFNAMRRRLTLLEGEIMIKVANASAPFTVNTPQGNIQALGQQLSVRLAGESTWANALLGPLEISLASQLTPPIHLPSRQSLRFSASSILTQEESKPYIDAWTDGMLIVHERRLDEFLTELSRYRKGWIRCDPAVGALRVSGSYPLADTGKILKALSDALPISISYMTNRLVKVGLRN